MDLVTQAINTATKKYEEGHLEAALAGFAQVVKWLREATKLKKEFTQQTSQKT